MKTAIIIGGGIAGCSTAYALAKRGISVTLIERHHKLAQAASGNPVAMLYPKFNTANNTMAKAGFQYTSALIKQFPNNDDLYDLCGLIQLAFSTREAEKQAALLEASLNQLKKQNIQLLSDSEASEQAQLSLSFGGLYLPKAGWIKPQLLCAALVQASNIETVISTKAISLKQAGSHWQVSLKQTAQEKELTLEADMVVICNANDIQLFEQCKHIPITPVRGQVNFFAESDMSQQLSSVICSDHYLSPAVDGFHSIGTSYAPNDLNPALSAADTKANLAALHAISPTLANSIDPSKVTGRVAWRSATKDYLPLAGQLIDEATLRKNPLRYNDKPHDLPWLKGLYMNAGHGSKGMITAPLSGELIANLACKESLIMQSPTASTLSPSRFLLRALGLKKMAQNLYPI